MLILFLVTETPHVLLCASVQECRQAEHISEHAELLNHVQHPHFTACSLAMISWYESYHYLIGLRGVSRLLRCST